MFAVPFRKTMASAKRTVPDPGIDLRRASRREAVVEQAQRWNLAQEARKRQEDAAERDRQLGAVLARASERFRLEKDQGREFRHTYAQIERRILKVFGFSKTMIHSPCRARRLVLARQAVLYWACRLTDLSLPRIGRLMGGRDHTTVLHGRDKYPQKRKAMGRNLRALS